MMRARVVLSSCLAAVLGACASAPLKLDDDPYADVVWPRSMVPAQLRYDNRNLAEQIKLALHDHLPEMDVVLRCVGAVDLAGASLPVCYAEDPVAMSLSGVLRSGVYRSVFRPAKVNGRENKVGINFSIRVRTGREPIVSVWLHHGDEPTEGDNTATAPQQRANAHRAVENPDGCPEFETGHPLQMWIDRAGRVVGIDPHPRLPEACEALSLRVAQCTLYIPAMRDAVPVEGVYRNMVADEDIHVTWFGRDKPDLHVHPFSEKSQRRFTKPRWNESRFILIRTSDGEVDNTINDGRAKRPLVPPNNAIRD
ncbi:MAG: hypothetical protein AAF610_12655 [Pseudomonadota bacterium]